MRYGWLPLVLLLAACSASGKGPVLASSGEQTTYAVHYADVLNASSKAVADAQAREKRLSSGFGGWIDELKKPDWDKVETIIDDSDAAGHSAAFADERGEVDAVKGFWDAEKDAITGRVIGNAQHTTKEAGCTADVASPVAFSLNDAITKQLQKRLRAKNEAFVTIERYKMPLGPQNTTTLEKLADDISGASYDVNVAMVLQRERLARIVDDKSSVKKTLDRFIQEETAYQAEPGRTDAEKKASSDRVNVASKTRSEIDQAAAQAQSTSKHMDTSIAASKRDYEDALKALRARWPRRGRPSLRSSRIDCGSEGR